MSDSDEGTALPDIRSLLPMGKQDALDNVKILEKVFNEIRPGKPIPNAYIAVVVQDFKFGKLLRNYDSPSNVIQAMDRHILLSNSFLSSTSGSLNPPKQDVNLDTAKIKAKSINKGVERIKDSDKAKALDRDGHKCVLTGMANPELAHVLPHSALGDSKTAKQKGANRAITKACWEATATMVDQAFHDTYLDNIDNVNNLGFEFPSNVVSIAPHMHGWLDRGFWSFRARAGTEDNDVEFVWLPGDFCDEDTFPKHVSDVNEYIHIMLILLEHLQKQRFPARTPSAGWIGTHNQDGRLLRTGDVITVNHATPADRTFFRDMVRFQWECMLLLTLRGVTKSEVSRLTFDLSSKRSASPDSNPKKPKKSRAILEKVGSTIKGSVKDTVKSLGGRGSRE